MTVPLPSQGSTAWYSWAQQVHTKTTTELDGKQAADADLTAIAALAPADGALLSRQSGAWTGRTPAQVRGDLGVTGHAWVDAATYGWAPGASAATNDTAIAAAIAAAKAGSRRVWLGAGDFHVSVPVDLRASSTFSGCVEMAGAGRAATRIIQDADTADVLQVGGFSGYVHDVGLRHASDSPGASTGAGLVFHKCAYSFFERLSIVNNGRAIAIAQENVPEPGSSSGTSNWMFSCSFRDLSINRWSQDALYLHSVGGNSTGSAWSNIYVENVAVGGTKMTPTGRALSCFSVDEMVFNQLNIENLITSNTPILTNNGGTVVINGLHFEQCEMGGTSASFARAFGDSGLIVNGMTVAFSDVAPTGSSGPARLFTAQAGGKVTARGITLNNVTKTIARRFTAVELGDTDVDNAVDIGDISYQSTSALDAPTDTAPTNTGLKRIGDTDYRTLSDSGLAAGEATMDRRAVVSSTITNTAGALRLTYFTARRTETVTSTRSLVGGTAAAGATLARIGVYSVAANGDLTLVASTASDTTLWTTPTSVQTKALSTSFVKVAGQRYAVGLLIVGATTNPNMLGTVALTSAEAAIDPRLCATLAAQTDLPASVTAASLATTTNQFYVALTP